jgi:raffinose/stachyose/melibiose transport system permease protein
MQSLKPRYVKYNWIAYLYVLPGFLIFGLFILWPILDTVRFSFYEWDGIREPVFTGLSNFYHLILDDETFHTALWNNLKFMLFYTLFPIAVGLLLTALMTRRQLRGLSIFRAGLFVPYVMSMIVVGVVWRWIYNPAFGPLNQTLKMIGLDFLAKPWLGDFQLALPSVGLVGTWVQYGFCMVLFIAGVQQIEETLYDAAKIDGANEFHQFWHITLPGIRNQISVALVITFISALRVFDLIFVTTRGGPGEETTVVSLWLYRNAFQLNQPGYAASIAVVLTLIILAFSFVLITIRQRTSEE